MKNVSHENVCNTNVIDGDWVEPFRFSGAVTFSMACLVLGMSPAAVGYALGSVPDATTHHPPVFRRIKPRLLEGNTREISFSEFASLAGVSIPTLRHYFPTRTDVVVALIEHIGEEGKPYLGLLATTEFHDLEGSLLEVGRVIQAGIRVGATTRLHEFGLSEGMSNSMVGPSYLSSILEPTLQALEERLAEHIARGEMLNCDVRFASLNFMAPILVASLHQERLGGVDVRPMRTEMLLAEQIAIFTKAYGVNPLANTTQSITLHEDN